MAKPKCKTKDCNNRAWMPPNSISMLAALFCKECIKKKYKALAAMTPEAIIKRQTKIIFNEKNKPMDF